ncbi:MAG TPA: bi-domain-containing oxidoreductase [Bryobacteraceae bacterium]|jgi:predicted dehydrogenase/threonine dehydrogenase-like Zn-dependent dehydrogenase
MRTVAEDYKTGAVRLLEVPQPALKPGCLLVSVRASLISAGTERAMLEIGRKSMVGKAIARPDWVKQVIDKIGSDGILETWRQATARLAVPVSLGYSAAGIVEEVGPGVAGLSPGDRVACVGHPYAAHAEVLCVPRNLCIPMPDGVGFESACYAMLGAIALNSVRLAEPALGENVAVIGLGLLGLLGLEILRAAGCRVIGIDVADDKLALAREIGAAATIRGDANVEARVAEFTGGVGVDSTIVFAGADSASPVHQAAAITRVMGRVVVPGLVKLNLPRKVCFEKQLSIVVPRAGGPGGTEPEYEARGKDFPVQYVRWTEGRNVSAFLNLIGDGRIQVDSLTTHRFPIERALEAYDLLQGKVPSEKSPIGIVLAYSGTAESSRGQAAQTLTLRASSPRPEGKASPGIGVIGAGLFVQSVFVPVLKKAGGIRLRGLATASGLSARHAGDSAGFEYCSTDYRAVLADAEVDAVLIATRHNLHAQMVVEALAAGKHVFVEKPLASSEEELRSVMEAYRKTEGRQVLMVGFNRRFAPATRTLVERLGSGPAAVHCRVNAGAIPSDSWVHDEEGGGRIIGEVCHFVDLVQALTGGCVRSVSAAAMAEGRENPLQDTLSITLSLDNGSVGSIVYVANGDKSFPRERVEVFRAGSVGLIDNFRKHSVTSGGRTRRWKLWSLDRGHGAELEVFFKAVRTGQQPVPFEDYVATTLTTFAIHQALAQKTTVEVNPRAELGSPEA